MDINALEKEIEELGIAVTPSTTNTLPGYLNAPYFDAARTRTLLRKLDWHLVPFLALLYL